LLEADVTDLPRRFRVRESVFARLLAIMVVMAMSLVLLVGSYFWFIVRPSAVTSIGRALKEQALAIAATAPDKETAARLGAQLGFDVRFEGPAGGWSTAGGLPTIADVRRSQQHGWGRGLQRSHYYVVDGPNGAYLFAWDTPSVMQEAHDTLLIVLLVVMTAVVLSVHTVLKRLLRPLRGLSEGVARLGAGELDVALPNESQDEFGRLTAAFNQMVGRIREMIATREQLLLDVSHELRSPLTRMKVALELMPPGEQRTGMAADVADMERMVTELLELERLRGGRGLTIECQDLVPILYEVAAQFRNTPPGVRMLPVAPEMLMDVDGEKIRVVLRNLLENAIKYSSPQNRPVDVSAVREGETVVIRISDYGPGIRESDRERVFEPFFRVDRSRTKSTGGYGLGLSISKRIVEAHRGTIAVENTPGAGATFTLTLPRQHGAGSTAVAQP
jgi:signal transduction histidine kinase